MKRIFLHIMLLAIATVAMADAVGTWKLYPSYADIKEVQYIKADSSEVFVLASGNLFEYHNSDHTFSEFIIEGAQSATGTSFDILSDRDIKHIAWCATAKKLIIVYSDGMIDLLNARDRSNPTVTSIVGLKETTLFNDKAVDSVRVGGQFAYLTTSSHIIKIDIKDEYIVQAYNTINPSQVEGMSTAPLMEPVTLDYKYGSTTVPDGPNTNYWWRLTLNNGKLYCADGIYSIESKGDLLHPGNVKIWDGSRWSALPQNIVTPKTSNYKCASKVVVDPRDDSHVFVLSYRGLYEFRNNVFTNFYNKTDFADPTASYGDLLLAGAYDTNNNLWFISNNSPYVSVLTSSGTFSKFDHSNLLDGDFNDAIDGTIVDSRGIVWFCSTRYDKGRVFQYYPSADYLKRYDRFVNQDSIEYQPYLRGFAEDKKENIWVATRVGPFYISADDILAGKKVMTQHKVNRDDGSGLADYLLSGVDIQGITVDQANNKWFATSGSGVYVISDDCNVQLNHFTKENSPLPSNNVADIKIDSSSGTVFITTDGGLCSYQSDVVDGYGELNADNVYAYPNPVPPEYTGKITIVGLTNGCTLQIVSTAGQIVHTGKCTSGSYSWSGCDSTGNRVASGIYMVLVSNSEGSDGCVTKIAVIK